MKKNIYIFTSLLIILLFITPNLILINSELSMPFPKDWDLGNILLWQYSSMNGELIFKDFWFPYTESIRLFGLDLSRIGLLFFYKLVLFTSFSIVLYKLFDNKIIALALFVFIVLGSKVNLSNNLPLFWGIDRYLLSIVLVLSFVLAKDKFNTIGVIIFAIGLFSYQDQLIVSSIPILYIFYINFRDKKYNFNLFIKSRLDIFIIILIFCIYIIKLYYFDQLNGFIYFYQSYGDMYSYAFSPADILGNLWKISSLDFIYIFIPIVTFLSLCNKKIPSENVLVCQSIALLTFFVVLKFLLRNSGTQPLLFAFLCIIFLIKYYLASFKEYPYFIGASIACVFFSFSNSYLQSIINLQSGISNIENSISLLLSGGNVKSDFGTSRFKNFKDEIELADEVLDFARLNKIDPKIYYFGEPSLIYILLKQKIPYYTSLYDASSIKAQSKLIDWIDNSANILIIDKTFTNFDGVPNVVRSSKLISYLVNNFVIKEKFGNFYIAIKQKPNFNEDYLMRWIEIYGKSINVNKLYSSSSVNCKEFSIDLLEPRNNKNTKTIYFDENKFEIIFNIDKKNLNHLCMPLSDLWFFKP